MECVKLVVPATARINTRSVCGRAVFHWSCSKRHLNVTAFLFMNGAHMNREYEGERASLKQ